MLMKEFHSQSSNKMNRFTGGNNPPLFAAIKDKGGVSIDGKGVVNLAKCPIELLERSLEYLDCESIVKFWLAVCSCDQHKSHVWPMLDALINQRTKELKVLCLEDSGHSPTTDEKMMMTAGQQTRSLSRRLVVLEYSQTLQHTIWCGRVVFKDPLLPDWSSQSASVALKTSTNWNIHTMQQFQAEFCKEIQLSSQLYNFVPVQPFGELIGITPKDQATLRDIRHRLEQRDQVMTLRYPNPNVILRIISPEQASQRLSAFPRLRDRFDTFPQGLLCCWEVRSDWDVVETLDSNIKFDAIFHSLDSYRKHGGNIT